jgi:UDP-glucose:(heptosyl)LPS alpha-1,3-glucosyltransferase
MDIAIVTDRWDAGFGGCEQYVAELAASLARAAHRLRVICRTVGRDVGAPAGGVYACGGRGVVGEVRLHLAVARYRALSPAAPVLATRPIAGATHYQLHSGVLIDAFAAEQRAMVSSIRRAFYNPALHLNPRRSLLLRTEARLFRSVPRPGVMTFSASARDTVVRRFHLPADAVRVSPQGTDLGRFHPPSPSSAATRGGPELQALFVGHNFVLKGLRTAISATAASVRRGMPVKLIVAGRGPVGPFAALAARLGVADRVQFLGPIDVDRLADLYRRSDVLLHPTFYDPFPRAVVEALACGCAVITTRCCGVAEHISAGREGFVVDDPADATASANALLELGDPRRRAEVQAAAACLGRTFDFARHAASVADWLGAAGSSCAP